ncbi:hypothetical protein OS125_11430 [Corynebacterium sp. P7003]|uniref:Uncharacterized protein n=1 Tax=Corynebacterium pygosceleis TaxID=2800406 RepID=A0ABT3WUP0_9CORY|nr:hypothetical protein [Corynebacterium pygosceleis]MCX7445843.1 hypothetical protein [Corynebacterium pygosceleis]
MTTLDQVPENDRRGRWVRDPLGSIGYIVAFSTRRVSVVYPQSSPSIEEWQSQDFRTITVLDRPRVDLPGAGETAGYWLYDSVVLSPRDGSVVEGRAFGEHRDECRNHVLDRTDRVMRRRWVGDWEQVEP